VYTTSRATETDQESAEAAAAAALYLPAVQSMHTSMPEAAAVVKYFSAPQFWHESADTAPPTALYLPAAQVELKREAHRSIEKREKQSER